MSGSSCCIFSSIVRTDNERESLAAPKELIVRADQAIRDARQAVKQFRSIRQRANSRRETTLAGDEHFRTHDEGRQREA